LTAIACFFVRCVVAAYVSLFLLTSDSIGAAGQMWKVKIRPWFYWFYPGLFHSICWEIDEQRACVHPDNLTGL